MKGEDVYGETTGFIHPRSSGLLCDLQEVHNKITGKVIEYCRRCGKSSEIIEHICLIRGCTTLSATNFTQRHNNIAKIHIASAAGQ
jgi:hypothetical protein